MELRIARLVAKVPGANLRIARNVRAQSSHHSTSFTFTRSFSNSTIRNDWLLPSKPFKSKVRKGRPRVSTGGSVRGTVVVWGDYGLRMIDHHRRISAAQLRISEECIKKKLRGMRYKLYKRVSASTPVFSSGNEMRMGKGKGSFDHWASRVANNMVIFEIKSDIHEKVIKQAFKLAGNKLPGKYEFVTKNDPPVMGTTRLVPGVTPEFLFRPRLPIAPNAEHDPASTARPLPFLKYINHKPRIDRPSESSET